MIKRVRNDWIEGVLNQSLYKVARIELGLADKSKLIEQPINAVVQVPDRPPLTIPAGIPISQVFDEQSGALLILGAPGTGKTTLLLELARDLLDRAESDESHPIPVVFNLSSWAVRRQPLVNWLVSELNQRSDVPKKLARQWMESEQILPLLDGLDEVALAHREGCAEAINVFRREHGLLQIAVCSRIADYEALGVKLRLRNAVEVRPLTQHQTQDYLERVGEPLRGLRAVLEGDLSLWELLETPLMLWVAMFAYRGMPQVSAPDASLKQRRHQLLAHFVDAMFRWKGSKVPYRPEQTAHWLSSLACTLIRNNQTVLYIDNLDFNWLPTRAHQWLARAQFAVASALFGGLSVMPIGPWAAMSRRSIALIYGLIWLVGGYWVGPKIRPAETTHFLWGASSPNANRRIRAYWVILLILPMVVGLISGLTKGLWFGLMSGLFGSTIVWLLGAFSPRAAARTRSFANEGTYRSMRMALKSGLIAYAMAALVFGLFLKSPKWLLICLSTSLLGAWVYGGLFAFKHILLRCFLWLHGSSPLRYVQFLEYAKDLLFLRRVGGGYIFTHRMLMEYFASVHTSPAAEVGSTDPTGATAKA